MPWPGASLKLCLLLLAATVGPPGLNAQQSVGCIYSERLCLEDEWCYDDLAFGRCLQAAGDVTEEDLFRFDLQREELHELSAELRRLFALGYRWSHAYTQCRLQAMLYSEQHDIIFDQNSCTHLVDQDLEAALRVLEGQVPLDPQEVAIIKYTPSDGNPHGAFADEVYYPPENDMPRQDLRQKILQPNAIDLNLEDPYSKYEVNKRDWVPQMHRRSLPQYFTESYNTPGNFRMGKESRDDLEFLPQFVARTENQQPYYEYAQEQPQSKPLSLEDMVEMYPIVRYLNDMRLTPPEIESLLAPGNYDRLMNILEQLDQAQHEQYVREMLKRQMMEEEYQNDAVQESLVPDRYNPQWFPRGSIPFVDDFPEPRIYIDESENEPAEENGSGHQAREEIFRERKGSNIFRELKTQEQHGSGEWGQIEPNPGIYTEGGVVYGPPEQLQEESIDKMSPWKINKLLEKYKLGFKRPERLDVKKPGPPFDPQVLEAVNNAIKEEEENPANIFVPKMMKKEPRGVHPNPSHELHESENEYVYVKFKNNLSKWKQGQDIIGNITNLLRLEPGAFTDGHVDPHGIAFKVQPNGRGLNVTDVARSIDLIKDRLEEVTGVEVTSVGIGDRAKMQTVLVSKLEPAYSTFFIVIFLVCSILVALIFATLLLLLIKKQVKKFEKLQNIGKTDTEASKDYQDLCRARMAGKQPPPNDSTHGRITSLSRESEQSPSSRSSTSSWSEEPAMHNLDISTGHMVLTYMEDHLKNKDRLEQEWVALCAYVAEPSEVTIALKEQNAGKNRYKEVVPYDHARVVLNELSNAQDSDYINASSITDHDPRNPAYIATQGPLPQTAAEFWQLIWEQGAVVIVMLTRLTEGGAAMCHRYWPEEGSDVYHIYEVHLVSEHIWCDDYLVRSFYLKNVRTGETRTVTQFHFLSWPETGVPASTKALLEFRRKVNKSYRGRSCPIVVHCSDGAGRTGTYCLIDMVLSRMLKGAKEIDIAATLEHLRDQRPRMVATKQQFEFVLTAVAEEVHAILKALPPQANPTSSTQEKEK